MTASEITHAADLGRPKQRLYYLLQERHQKITNRIWGQSLRPVETAIEKFANELADGFKSVFKPCQRKSTSGAWITLQWKDGTEVSVKLDDQMSTCRDANCPPFLSVRKVNDHRRRMKLRANETPQQIVVRVLDHFRNTESELSTVLSWRARSDGVIKFDIGKVNVLTPKPVGTKLHKIIP